MLNKIQKYIQDTKGSIALMSVVLIPLLLTIAAIAIDYSVVIHKRQQLQIAANNAVLSAANEANVAYVNLEDTDLDELVRVAGEAAFAASAERLGGIEIENIIVTPEIVDNSIEVDISAKASYETAMLKVAGIDTLSVGVASSAKIASASYMNFNFLFDVSASMGIGATSDDQQKVVEATGCAFACHINQTLGSSPYDRARANGAEMRIDVAKSAAKDTLEIIKKNTTLDEQFTVGAYYFDNEFFTILDGSAAEATDMDYVGTQIDANIYMRSQGGGTNIENAISELATRLPNGGSGRSISDRRQIIVILTDGVENSQAFYNGQGWIPHEDAVPNSPFKKHAHHEINYALNPGVCQQLSDRNIDVFFIYTEYLKPQHGDFRSHDQQRFAFIENQLFNIIPDRFSTCAGDAEHVFKTTTPEEIETAFTDLLKEITAPLHKR
ncbi:MAG: VWA domain-containing protein [Pseudomonadota bacterium]